MLSALSDDHCRIVLRSLEQTTARTLDLDWLVDRVVDAETVPDEAATFRKRVRIALHHVHLPKLAAAGLIEYDTATNRVELIDDELRAELLAVVADAE